MKKTTPPKGFHRPRVQARNAEQTSTATMESIQNTEDIGLQDAGTKVLDATPDELREQLRELTQKNCLAALQEIEGILERRGLRMYPRVHVEGNSVINSTIAIVPK